MNLVVSLIEMFDNLSQGDSYYGKNMLFLLRPSPKVSVLQYQSLSSLNLVMSCDLLVKAYLNIAFQNRDD